MNAHRCTLIDGPARNCFVNVSPDDQELLLCHTPVAGPVERWVYRRVGADRFAFVRSEPYSREPEKRPIVVAHSEEKTMPELKDWERRSG